MELASFTFVQERFASIGSKSNALEPLGSDPKVDARRIRRKFLSNLLEGLHIPSTFWIALCVFFVLSLIPRRSVIPPIFRETTRIFAFTKLTGVRLVPLRLFFLEIAALCHVYLINNKKCTSQPLARDSAWLVYLIRVTPAKREHQISQKLTDAKIRHHCTVGDDLLLV
jgi:hypothetical protein